MKSFIFLLFLILSFKVQSSILPECGPNLMRVWSQSVGFTCVPRFPTQVNDCIVCQGAYPNYNSYPNWFQNFPPAIYQPQVMPWWAYQGNMHYPNLHYPGAWSYPGMNSHYYPGQGEVYAAKPNVYVESIYEEKKFSLTFDLPKEELSFLATTPILDEQNTWRGKIIGKDKFEVDDIYYDYLFYDIRLPKEKMQFTHGHCATREDTISWMLKDLKEMSYPAIALQDFEEHWKVKIPDYPYFCIYPQYNQQLDSALPVTVNLAHTNFIRALFILVPHKEAPDANSPQTVPLPLKDSTQIRPPSLIKHENMLKEWGVAFLGE